MAVTNIRGQQILNGTVQYVDIQNVTANTVLANNTASATTIKEVALANNNLLGRGASGNIAAITLGSGLAFSGTSIIASSVPWSAITTTPTTLAGYGITDALSASTTSTQNGYFGDVYLYDDTTPSHYLQVTNFDNLTAARVLRITVNDADRTISLSGSLTVSASATVSGTNTGDQTLSGLGGQPQLNGTGFVKASGTTITYDNSTYYLASNPSGYITGNQSITLSTDVSGGGTTAISCTVVGLRNVSLPALGASAGFLRYTGTGTNTWVFDTSSYYLASNPSGYTSNTGTVTSVGGTGTVSGLTLSGTVTTSGNLTLGGTLSLTAANVNAVGAITNNTSGTAGSTPVLTASGALTTQQGDGTVIYSYALTSGQAGLFSSSDNANSILTVNRHPGNYYSQFGFSSNGNLYYRNFVNTAINTSQAWQTVWTSSSLTNLNQLSNGPGYITSVPALINRVQTNQINRGSFGSISISGATGGYSGIDFTDSSTTFMVRTSDQLSGLYKTDNTWLWYFDGSGILQVGTVPWTSINSRPTAVSAFTNDSGYITSASVGNGTLTLNVSGSGLSGSQTFTANQSTAATFTVTSNATTAATANTIAYRDANGDLTTRYFFGSYMNSSDDINTGTVTYIMAKFGDNYLRSATPTKVGNFLTRVQVTTNTSSPYTPDPSTYDVFALTSQSTTPLTINAPSSQPYDGKKILFRLRASTAITVTFQNGSSTQYRASTDLALPTTIQANKTLYVGFIWNNSESRWDMLAKLDNFA